MGGVVNSVVGAVEDVAGDVVDAAEDLGEGVATGNFDKLQQAFDSIENIEQTITSGEELEEFAEAALSG